MEKLHQNGFELDADYDYCNTCKKAVIGGLTADANGIEHECAYADGKTPASPSVGSLHSRQASKSVGFLSLLLLFGNVALCIYSHLGLSAEIMSNIPPEVYANLRGCAAAEAAVNETQLTCSKCSPADVEIYFAKGQAQGTDAMSAKCGFQCGLSLFNGQTDCAADCVIAEGYSPTCALCFAEQGVCVVQNCLGFCAQNQTSPECKGCAENQCTRVLRNASGLPLPIFDPNNSSWNTPINVGPTPASSPPTAVPPARFYGIPTYGQISFVYSVKRAYTAGAQALAVVIVIASGIWPYSKCVLMAVAWFVPMSNKMCTRILQIACWFGRFSLVDVLAVLVLSIGLDFDLVGGVVRIRTESRPAIVAFGIVAIWALIQSEWMLKRQLTGELRANNYRGFETRSQGRCKHFWDILASAAGLAVLSAACFAVAVAAITGPGYTFVIDDLSSNSTGIPRQFALKSILDDVRVIDFPAIVCLFYVIVLPLLTSVCAFLWALTGMRPAFGFNLAQMGRMCCMDIFFISAVIFGEEYGLLLPAVLAGVNPCYKISAVATLGHGLGLCLLHGFINVVLVYAIDHNVHWAVSPALPYKATSGRERQ